MKKREMKKMVREDYGKITKRRQMCCSPKPSSCCIPDMTRRISRKIGYTKKDMDSVPDGANLGLGCGNPVALAALNEGDIVLDLGSGGGFDCFIAAQIVGRKGNVIGVDMTPEMIDKARENAEKGGYENVEFRLGEIEHLPAADNSVDVVISNCVINLSPEKGKVFQDILRVLKPEGRILISDIVLLQELPEYIKNSRKAYIGCVSGAMMKDEYLKVIHKAGFEDVRVVEEAIFPYESSCCNQTGEAVIENFNIPKEEIKKISGSIASVRIYGKKPGNRDGEKKSSKKF
jgi:SAM-dependent methyltransferase